MLHLTDPLLCLFDDAVEHRTSEELLRDVNTQSSRYGNSTDPCDKPSLDRTLLNSYAGRLTEGFTSNMRSHGLMAEGPT